MQKNANTLEFKVSSFFDAEAKFAAIHRRLKCSNAELIAWDTARIKRAFKLAHLFLLKTSLVTNKRETSTISDREKIKEYYQRITKLKKDLSTLHRMSIAFHDSQVSAAIELFHGTFLQDIPYLQHKDLLNALTGGPGKSGASPIVLSIALVKKMFPQAKSAKEITEKIEFLFENFGLGRCNDEQGGRLHKMVKFRLSRMPKR